MDTPKVSVCHNSTITDIGDGKFKCDTCNNECEITYATPAAGEDSAPAESGAGADDGAESTTPGADAPAEGSPQDPPSEAPAADAGDAPAADAPAGDAPAEGAGDGSEA